MAASSNFRAWRKHHPLFIPHTLMMFICIINFDIMRNLKESLLVTRLGAEVIPFVKLWVVVPMAFIFLVTYSLLANRFNKRLLFIIILMPFLFWMLLFPLAIYPNLEFFAPESFALTIRNYLPEHLSLISGLIYYWPLALFFALAELWGSAILCILFWTTVNDANSTETATQTYPMMTMIGNAGSMVAGPLMVYCITSGASVASPELKDSLFILSCVFVGLGLFILMLNEYCYRVNQPSPSSLTRVPQKLSTTSLPLLASTKYLLYSPYLGCIALVMLSYCIAINMIEVAWKSQLIRLYPTEVSYSLFMGQLTFFYGLGCLLCGLLTRKLLNRSWKVAALATPVIMAATALPFFLMIFYKDFVSTLNDQYSLELLSLVVILGMFMVVLSKSAKYTLFDSTKEMSFIPLNDEHKYKGKAAIELIVSRFGKAGSALVQQLLIVSFGSLTGAMPWLAGIFIMTILLWIPAVKALDSYYECSRS